MSIYKADSIELSDEDDIAFANYQVTKDQLVQVVKHFGYTHEEAFELVMHNQAAAINNLISCKLFLLFRSGDLSAMPDVLEKVEMHVVPIDDCQLIYIGEPIEQPLSKEQINNYRKELGPHFPNHIKSFKIELMGPNGALIGFKSYDMLAYEKIQDYFTYYQQWLDKQEEWISPVFEQVYREIGEWLRNRLEGITPQKESFINWLLYVKQSLFKMDFVLPANSETGALLTDKEVTVTLTFGPFGVEPTSQKIQEDIIEYGIWKRDQVEQSYSKLLEPKQQMSLTQDSGSDLKQLSPPLTSERPSTPPTYNAQRLKTDYKYRFDRIDELQAHMAIIEPYAERVKYFMQVTQDMGLGLGMFNEASYKLPEQESQYNGSVFLDESGNIVPYKHWRGISYSNDAEHGTLKKMWFLAVRHEEYSAFGQYKNIPLEQRKADYLAGVSKANIDFFTRRYFEQIEEDIKNLQADYNAFRKKQTGLDAWEPAEVERQRLNAPALIEREIIGIAAIDWLAFKRTYHLQLFGIMWDMVAFKLFLLNLSQTTNEASDDASESKTTDHSKESKQAAIRPFPDLLAGSFTDKELNKLLIHVRMKDATGKNIWPQKYKSAIWGIIDALNAKNHLIKTTRIEYGKSLGAHLGLGNTRVKDGHSTIQDDMKKIALSFLNQLVSSTK